MIRSSLMLVLLLFGGPAAADDGTGAPAADAPEEGEGDPADEDPLSPHRTDLNVLMERTIGTASQPIAFDWRRSKVQIAGTGSFLFELNNFNSGRAGAQARVPAGGMLFEAGASYVFVGDTPSSRQLALTPYRQPGRPSRVEIDLGLTIPLAEGVVTASPKVLPAAQLVFHANVGIRYSLYPTAFRGMRFGQVARATVNPGLTETEIENLDGVRLGAMAVDRARYNVMVGIGNDVYFKQGAFLTPRINFCVPLLAPASNSDMLFWADFSLAVGFSL